MRRAEVLNYQSSDAVEPAEAAELAKSALAAGVGALLLGIVPISGLMVAIIAILQGRRALRVAVLAGTRQKAIIGIVLGGLVLAAWVLLLAMIGISA
jgi:hypothetical protein